MFYQCGGSTKCGDKFWKCKSCSLRDRHQKIVASGKLKRFDVTRYKILPIIQEKLEDP